MPSSTKKKRKSGNPAKQVSKAANWKRKSTATKIELPSGEVALCNRIGMKSFLEKGTIPDHLTPIVQKVIREKSFLPPEEAKDLANNTMIILETQEMLDRALCLTVVEPKVKMPPGCAVCGKYQDFNDKDVHNRKGDNFDHEYVQEDRDDEQLYADEVDLEDKLFLFNWSVGGGTDLESFRKGWQESLERMASLQDDGSTS